MASRTTAVARVLKGASWTQGLRFNLKTVFVELSKAGVRGSLGDPVGAAADVVAAVQGVTGKPLTAEEATRRWVLRSLVRAVYMLVGGNYGKFSRSEEELAEICDGLDLGVMDRPAELTEVLRHPEEMPLVRELQAPLAQWLQGMDDDAAKSKAMAAKLGETFKTALDAEWEQNVSHTEREQILAYVLNPRQILVMAEGGGPKLTLTPPRRTARRDPIESDLDLLLAYHRSIPLIGRQAEMESLLAWLDSEKDIAVRTVSGSAGAGKTRLAIELIEAAGEEWDAGFVTDQELRRFHAAQNLGEWGWRKPTLIVVDYAAALLKPLWGWLGELAQQGLDDKPPLRLLLLERQADEESGWLRSLISTEFSGGGVEHLFDPIEPLLLNPLGSEADRREILSVTMAEAARIRQMAAPALPSPGEDAHFDQRLESAAWSDPLVLMMAALVAVESGVGTAMALSRRDLAFDLAKRRLKRIRKFAAGGEQSVEASLLVHMAAYVTLCQGLSHSDALAATATECAELGKEYPGGHGVLVDDLERAMPITVGVAPVKPDILGEALVLLALAGKPEASDVVLRAAGRAGSAVAETVIQAAQNFSFEDPRETVAKSNEAPLEWLDGLVQRGAADEPGLLLAIDGAMPQDTVVLRDMAASVTNSVLERLAQLAADEPSIDLNAEVARCMSNLAVRMIALGRQEEALGRAEEASRIRRELARVSPDRFLPDLAVSLNNVAIGLGELGKWEEALQWANEAVELYRDLAEARPAVFLPGLASSLNTLANALGALVRAEEALARAEEAARISRQLATARPDEFTAGLAAALYNVARILSMLERQEEALERVEEAVLLCRELAAARPDAFLAKLAMSLNSSANRLIGLDRWEDASVRAEEALDLYRNLAAARRNEFLPELAMSLNNAANPLIELGRRREALVRIEEAVGLYRELAAARPKAFLQDLAISYCSLGRVRLAEWKLTQAVAAFSEGLGAITPLFQRLPAAFGKTTMMLARDYLQAAEKAGIEPDEEVLRPVAEVVQAMQADEGGKPTE